jgi:hypothetical protein
VDKDDQRDQTVSREVEILSGWLASEMALEQFANMIDGRTAPKRYLVPIIQIGGVEDVKDLSRLISLKGIQQSIMIYSGNGDQWTTVKNRYGRLAKCDFTDMMLHIAEEVKADLNKPG